MVPATPTELEVGQTVDTMHLVAEWSHFLEALGRSEATLRNYSYAVLRFLSNHPKPLSEITESDVVAFLVSLPAHSTARARYVDGLRSFFSWAVERHHIAFDPCRALRPKAPCKPPPVALSPTELQSLLEAAMRRDPKRRWALQLCYALGTRRNELVHIAPEDVEAEAVLLRVTKGNKPRRVPLGPIAREALAHLEPSNGTILGVSAQTITHWAQEAARAAGLPRTKQKAHVLRATFATRLLSEGTPISVVSQLLGHCNVGVTSRYLAVLDEDKAAAVERL